MNTEAIRKLSKTFDEARAELSKLEKEAEVLVCSGHQSTAALSVNGRRIALTKIDHISYRAIEVRGVEMILLGVKKWYAAQIDAQRGVVAAAEQKLREVAINA